MVDDAKGHRQRLRERFRAGDAQALSDEAVLELALTYAIPQKDVQPLARRMIATFGGLRGVFDAERDALCAIDGVGEHAATLIHLIRWIGVHCYSASERAGGEGSEQVSVEGSQGAGGEGGERIGGEVSQGAGGEGGERIGGEVSQGAGAEVSQRAGAEVGEQVRGEVS